MSRSEGDRRVMCIKANVICCQRLTGRRIKLIERLELKDWVQHHGSRGLTKGQSHDTEPDTAFLGDVHLDRKRSNDICTWKSGICLFGKIVKYINLSTLPEKIHV